MIVRRLFNVTVFLVLLIIGSSIVRAAPFPYAPGATLDPTCHPGDTGCTVQIPSFTAGGDLTGSSTSQTVTALQGYPVASTTPTSSQVLQWNGSAWTPSTLSTSTASSTNYWSPTSTGIYYNGTGNVSVGNTLSAGLFSGNGSALAVPTGGRTVAMGDSITANGGGVSNGNMFWGSTSWVYQAAMASGGRMVLIKNVAHTGDLCDTQLALFDAQVTPLHPDKVVLMCGTNDLTANHTVPTIIASITAIVNKALAIGAVPILNTIPPKTASPGSVIPLNMAIVALARTLKVPVFDHYPLIVGTDGAYRSGYSGDGTHPTAATAQIMGSAWWTAMSSYYPAASSIFLPTMAGASTSWVVNPLFTTTQTITCNSVQVTIPTLWGSCGYTATPAVYPTFALTTNDTTINGNWWSITVPAMSGGLWMGSNANYTTGFTTGDCLMLSGRLKLSNVVASAGGQFGIAFGDGQAFMPSWASDITNGVFYFLYVVKSTDTVIKLNFAVNPGPSAAVTASVAQWGVVNLTTLGLAPNGCTL